MPTTKTHPDGNINEQSPALDQVLPSQPKPSILELLPSELRQPIWKNYFERHRIIVKSVPKQNTSDQDAQSQLELKLTWTGYGPIALILVSKAIYAEATVCSTLSRYTSASTSLIENQVELSSV